MSAKFWCHACLEAGVWHEPGPSRTETPCKGEHAKHSRPVEFLADVKARVERARQMLAESESDEVQR